MINKLSLTNFKCFSEQTEFELGKVSIFTGYNGRGKSTILQSLLLISQSVIDNRSIDRLHVGGEWIDLGDFEDILTTGGKGAMKFILDTSVSACSNVQLSYRKSKIDPKVGDLSACIINGRSYFETLGSVEDTSASHGKTLNQIPEQLIELFYGMHFLSANRCGPIKFVEKIEIPDYHRVGYDGIFSINTLSSYSDTINPNIAIDKSRLSLSDGVSDWMSFIMDGGNVQLKPSDFVLSVEFSGANSSGVTYKALNVGFGYSYILSIIVTALVAKSGSTVIVENPEAHLHPEAQSRITQLLSKLADSSVQVLIETHSEHILNGFRLNALKSDYALQNSDLAVYFFDKDNSHERLNIKPNGRIDNWPDGFFNQQEKDLAEIMRLGAKMP